MTSIAGPSPNENIHPWLRQHIQLVHKYYINEKFRENVTEGFLKLPNEIFMKSDERAERYRKTGNELYKKGDYQEALKEYNEAIAVANWQPNLPNGTDSELTINLSNRSMVLLKLQRYPEALCDIDLALNQVRSEQLKKKLDYRREECLKHTSSSEQSNHNSEEDSFKSKLSCDDDQQICRASEAIDKLDLVIQERSELSLLKKDYYFTRCFNCFKQLPTDLIMPCRGCNQVKFCSYSCSEETWNQGHENFCLFLTLFDHLTNKEVFRTPPLLACLQVLKLDLASVFAQARSGELPGELTHVTPNIIGDTDKLNKMAETAAHLLTYFTVIKRLPVKSESIPWKYDIELLAGILLMYLRRFERLGQLVTLTELTKPLDDEEPWYLDDKIIGYAVYPQVKKLPHNCNPNTAIGLFVNGRDITLRAVQPIEQNEIISFDYGVNCLLTTIKERKDYLMINFDYDCNCQACENGLQPKTQAYLCSKCSGPVVIDQDTVECLECNQEGVIDRAEVTAELDGCLYNYRQANLLLIRRDRDIVKAEDYLLDCYRRLKKILYPVNHNLIDICDRLSYCYKKMRKYKLSLIYAQKAFDCIDQAYHAFHKLRINCFFTLLDRQRNFLVFCLKKEKTEDEEFHNLFIETRQVIQDNLKQAHNKIKKLGFEKDYFESLIKSIESSLRAL